MAANIRRRGKRVTQTPSFHPSSLFFLSVCPFIRPQGVSSGRPGNAKAAFVGPLRAPESCCIVISSRRNESTHYVWLSSCSQKRLLMGDFSSLELLHVKSSSIKQQTPVFPCWRLPINDKQEAGWVGGWNAFQSAEIPSLNTFPGRYCFTQRLKCGCSIFQYKS